MTNQEIKQYAKKYEFLNNKAEKRAYKMVFAVLNGIIQQFKRTAKINLNVALNDVDKINYSIFKNLLENIYTSIGLEFALIEKNRIDNLKRMDSSFEVGFFSELWKQLITQLIQSPEITQRITKITEHTRRQIRNVLLEAQQNRLSAQQTARLINERIEIIGKNRALMIARTETTLAANMGAEFGSRNATIELDKVWIATRDGRTRDSHAAMNGKRVPRNEKFNVNGKMMKYPGDPVGGASEVINCRCTVAYVPSKKQIEEINKPVLSLDNIIQLIFINEVVN